MGRIAQQAVRAFAAGTLVFLVVVQDASAQAPYPVRTKNYFSWLVRAMDRCTTPSLAVTVMAPGFPASGCPDTNAVTDNQLTMESAKLRVTQRGKIRLLGRGFVVGDSVRLQLVLRVTQKNVTTNMGVGSVTFSDVMVECPKDPDAFQVKLNGSISGKAELGACLAPESALALGNVEILDVRLINALNGKAVAAPGVLIRK